MSVLPKWSGTCAAVLAAALIFSMPSPDSSAASRPAAKAPECPSAGTRVVTFARAVDGGGFVTVDGEEIRLSGVLPPGEGGETASEVAVAAARDAISRALSGRTVTLAPAEAIRDRYNRSVAQVFADGDWVQRTLLAAGSVRAAPDLASAACAKALLAAEAGARERRLGEWRGGFRVSDAS